MKYKLICIMLMSLLAGCSMDYKNSDLEYDGSYLENKFLIGGWIVTHTWDGSSELWVSDGDDVGTKLIFDNSGNATRIIGDGVVGGNFRLKDKYITCIFDDGSTVLYRISQNYEDILILDIYNTQGEFTGARSKFKRLRNLK